MKDAKDDITRRRFRPAIEAARDHVRGFLTDGPEIPDAINPEAFARQHGLGEEGLRWAYVAATAVGNMVRHGMRPEAVPEYFRLLLQLFEEGADEPPEAST